MAAILDKVTQVFSLGKAHEEVLLNFRSGPCLKNFDQEKIFSID